MKVKGLMLVVSGLAMVAGLTACNNDSKKPNKSGPQVSVLCRNQQGFEPNVVHYGQRNGRLVAFDARGNVYVLTETESQQGRMIDQCGRNRIYPRFEGFAGYPRRHMRRHRIIRNNEGDDQGGYDQNFYNKGKVKGDGEDTGLDNNQDYSQDEGDQADVTPDLK